MESRQVLWSEHANTLLCQTSGIQQTARSGSIFFSIEVVMKDSSSGFLNINMNGVVGMYLVLDLLSTVTKVQEYLLDEQQEISPAKYLYSRFDLEFILEVLPKSTDRLMDLLSLDFIFSQFCMFKARFSTENDLRLQNTSSKDEKDRNKEGPNVFARGLETTGALTRTALRSSGYALGKTIRFLGSAYTDVAVKLSRRDSVTEGGSPQREVDEGAVASAMRCKEAAENVHVGARVVSKLNLIIPALVH